MLGRVQQSGMGVVKGPEHLCYGQRLMQLRVVTLEGAGCGGILSMDINI